MVPCLVFTAPPYGMYGPAFQPPSPPRPWSWVSHSTVPLPPVVG